MTVALVLYCLAASAGVQALPIPSIKQCASLSCDDLHSCRTIPDIIWSCTITIFSCTWVAVHPNIPAPDEKWHTVALRRFQITVMALVAPELVILWAIRQRIMARKLAKEYRSVFVLFYTFKFINTHIGISRVRVDDGAWIFCRNGRIHTI